MKQIFKLNYVISYNNYDVAQKDRSMKIQAWNSIEWIWKIKFYIIVPRFGHIGSSFTEIFMELFYIECTYDNDLVGGNKVVFYSVTFNLPWEYVRKTINYYLKEFYF